MTARELAELLLQKPDATVYWCDWCGKETKADEINPYQITIEGDDKITFAYPGYTC